VQPDLKLNYSSGNHDDTGFGYGWSLSIPFIERYNKSGLQNLFATTTAAFFSSLSGELVASTTSGGMSPMMMSPSTSSGSAASNGFLTPIAIPPTSLGSQSAITSTSSPLVATSTRRAPPSLPPSALQLKLKTTPDRILGAVEVASGTIRYAYKTDLSVDSLPVNPQTLKQAQKSGRILGAELLDKRTSHSRTFATDKANVFVTEIVAGDPKYYRDDLGHWWVAEYGTTTTAAFISQTQGKQGFLSTVVSLLVPQPLYAQQHHNVLS